MGVVLSVNNLSFSYEPESPVWSGISLKVHSGEILSLLGPNGTGKTTLMRCMAGLETAGSGHINVEGTPIGKLSRKKAAQSIAFVPQMHNPVFAFSAIDVVVTGRTAHLSTFGAPSASDYEIARDAMNTFGIADLADKPYNETSGGERQLILFARAIAQQSRILLLDEPTSHLDFGNQIRILELIKKMAERGLAIVMTTHFPDHALAYSKRTVLIADQVMQGYGPTTEVITPMALTRLYGMNVEINSLIDGRSVCVAKP